MVEMNENILSLASAEAARIVRKLLVEQTDLEVNTEEWVENKRQQNYWRKFHKRCEEALITYTDARAILQGFNDDE